MLYFHCKPWLSWVTRIAAFIKNSRFLWTGEVVHLSWLVAVTSKAANHSMKIHPLVFTEIHSYVDGFWLSSWPKYRKQLKSRESVIYIWSVCWSNRLNSDCWKSNAVSAYIYTKAQTTSWHASASEFSSRNIWRSSIPSFRACSTTTKMTVLWLFCSELDYYYYNRFMVPWTVFGTTRVNRYQKGKTRKVKPLWIYWSER